MQSDTGTNLIGHIYHHRCRCGRITWEEETGGDFPTSKGWYLKWPVDPVEPGEFCCVCGCRLEADGTALDVLGSLVACQAALEEAMGALGDKDPRNPNS